MVCKKVIFVGRVQKIGFRYFVFDIVKQYKVYGYVRNLDDGSVEMIIQGNELEVEKIIDECKHKHPLAIINSTSIENIEFQNFTDFEIKRH